MKVFSIIFFYVCNIIFGIIHLFDYLEFIMLVFVFEIHINNLQYDKSLQYKTQKKDRKTDLDVKIGPTTYLLALLEETNEMQTRIEELTDIQTNRRICSI